MSGEPNEASIQAQLVAAVDILETARLHADGTMAGAGGLFDTLIQALEGEYTPEALSGAVARLRSAYSSIIDPGAASEFLTPILYEYGAFMSRDASLGYGAGYRDVADLFTALYEWFVDKSLTVESRAITFDTSVTASRAAGATLTRLTEDADGFNMEACHVEKKTFRCRTDQNNGAQEWAEVFEFLGTQASQDALLRASFGSGESSRSFLTCANAGTGNGGSLLNNASFSDYDATEADERFDGWAQTYGGAAVDADVTQDTVNYYRSHPGASTDASLKIAMDNVGDTLTLTQTLADMRIGRLDPDTPYYCRVMLNKTIGTAAGGTVTLTCGSKTAAITIASLGANWAELRIGDETLAGAEDASDQWFRNFDSDGFGISISWAAGTGGYLLVDDFIFAPYTLIDGTYWALTQSHATAPAPNLVDDTLTVTDTGGAPTTGKIQWWLWTAGFGYLPSSVSPTLADP